MAGRIGFKIISVIQTQSTLATRQICTSQQCSSQNNGGASPSLSLSHSPCQVHRPVGPQRGGLGSTAAPPRLINVDESNNMLVGGKESAPLTTVRRTNQDDMHETSHLHYEPLMESVEAIKDLNMSYRGYNMGSRESNFSSNETDMPTKPGAISREPNFTYREPSRTPQLPKSKMADYERPTKYVEEESGDRFQQKQQLQQEPERFNFRQTPPRMNELDRYQSSYQNINHNAQQQQMTDNQRYQQQESNNDGVYSQNNLEENVQQNESVQPQQINQQEKPKWWSEVRAFKDEKVVIRMPEVAQLDVSEKVKKIDDTFKEIHKPPKLDKIFMHSQTAAEKQLRGMKSKLDEERSKRMRYASMSGQDWVQYLARKRDSASVTKLRDPQNTWPPIREPPPNLDNLDDTGIEPIECVDTSEPLKPTRPAGGSAVLKSPPSPSVTSQPTNNRKPVGYGYGYGYGSNGGYMSGEQNRELTGSNKRPALIPGTALCTLARKRRHAYYSTFSKAHSALWKGPGGLQYRLKSSKGSKKPKLPCLIVDKESQENMEPPCTKEPCCTKKKKQPKKKPPKKKKKPKKKKQDDCCEKPKKKKKKKKKCDPCDPCCKPPKKQKVKDDCCSGGCPPPEKKKPKRKKLKCKKLKHTCGKGKQECCTVEKEFDCCQSHSKADQLKKKKDD